MSAHHVWGQRGRCDLRQPEGVGPNGRKLCRLCHQEVAPGRQSWCSEECVRAGWLKLSWPNMREHIIQRDRVCQQCSADHPGYRYDLSWWRWEPMPYRHHGQQKSPPSRAWEVDHIHPVSEGGTDDPANLRLLCYACHKGVTANWRRTKARRSA